MKCKNDLRISPHWRDSINSLLFSAWAEATWEEQQCDPRRNNGHRTDHWSLILSSLVGWFVFQSSALQISSLLGQLQNIFYCLISNIFLSPNIWLAHSQLWWTGDFTNKFTILWPLIKDALNWSQPTNGKNISQQWTESSLIFSPQTIEGNHKAVNLV